MRIRVNWPLVMLVLGVLFIVACTLLALMLTGTISPDHMKAFGVFVFGVFTGGNIPFATWWREKKISFQLESEPPKNGGAHHADQ